MVSQSVVTELFSPCMPAAPRNAHDMIGCLALGFDAVHQADDVVTNGLLSQSTWLSPPSLSIWLSLFYLPLHPSIHLLLSLSPLHLSLSCCSLSNHCSLLSHSLSPLLLLLPSPLCPFSLSCPLSLSISIYRYTFYLHFITRSPP